MENKVLRKKSREESSSKIEDETISPYVIYFDGVSYTVVKPKENGNDENIGYYNNLNHALKSIAKLLLNNKKTTTIDNFIKQFDEIMTKLNNKFNI
jgi:hypothetical protein